MRHFNITQAQQRELKRVIEERSFRRDREFTLASGRKSWMYFNMKPTMMNPKGAYLLGELIVDQLEEGQVDYVGGLAMGSVPLVGIVGPALYRRNISGKVGLFFMREEAKEHGTMQLIEGLAKGESLEGKNVVMLEDVTTTGGSILRAIRRIRVRGVHVDRVITIVDRQEGAKETLAAEGIKLVPLFVAENFYYGSTKRK